MKDPHVPMPLMPLMLLLLMMFMSGLPGAKAPCPTLDETNGTFTATVVWMFDLWDEVCTARLNESSVVTSFQWGETKGISGLGNDCLQFSCGLTDLNYIEVFLNKSDSSCQYEEGCSSDVQNTSNSCGTCSQTYTCVSAVYDKQETYYTGWYRYKHGQFSVASGYTCGERGSGPCADNECFNPFEDPKSGDQCLAKGKDYVTGDYVKYTCKESSTCDGDSTYVDLVYVERGCSSNYSYVSPGHVTWSDPCRHSVCVVTENQSEIVTSFKGEEGCLYEDQCVGVNQTISGHVLFACANLTCRKDTNSSESAFRFDVTETGCYRNGVCHGLGQNIEGDKDCKFLTCSLDGKREHYLWKNKFTGCFNLKTNSCTYNGSDTYTLSNCIVNRCDTVGHGRWKTSYKDSKSCKPKTTACTRKGIPGCRHRKKCYPVKGVITWDNCTQYVCYSADRDLNQGIYNATTATTTTRKPRWEPRATGCYGPKGCMKFGDQFVDPNTLNTYRCTYDLGGLGYKFAEIHKSCAAPDGTTLALGQSVLIDHFWFSCYRFGAKKPPVDRTAKPFTNYTCGKNPDTGDWKYTKIHYFTPEGKCKVRGSHCEEFCDYFDQPCTNVSEVPYRWRYLGDKFTRDGAECVCTQDYGVNNKPIPETGSLFDTPSLCGEKGVQGAACKDPNDSSILRQWGQLWTRCSSEKPLEVCACHPLKRSAFCSSYLPDVLSALSDMKI
ncbi:uncharacterized protein LOC143277665 [Babylonia areolata]|uniref:uncharacterized protein LOC143277665 n=1 Tax=Babylonia areolata TaxID=304850 RepID=UPI003FD04FFD